MSIVPAATPGVMVLRTRSEGGAISAETCMFIVHRMHKFDRASFKTSFKNLDRVFVKQAPVQKSCLTIPAAAQAIAGFYNFT